MAGYEFKMDSETREKNRSVNFERCVSKGLDCSTPQTSSTVIRGSGQRKRFKNTLHLWEFLLELLADDTCKSIICWEKKECGVFKLIDQHEVAKRWGKLKQNKDMNYSKLSRSLRLYYQQGIIAKVKGQMLVYKFNKLPYEYQPGVTRSWYRQKFVGQDTSPLPKMQTEPPASSSLLCPTNTPHCFTCPDSRQTCWCSDTVPLTSLHCISKSRIFYPVFWPAEFLSRALPL
ncbi:ETS-related transcription factor Elf-4-like isoform X2 [Montipora foliosa]